MFGLTSASIPYFIGVAILILVIVLFLTGFVSLAITALKIGLPIAGAYYLYTLGKKYL